MTADKITVITAVSGARVTKLFKADGSVSQYENAATWGVAEREFSGIRGLAAVLRELQTQFDTCVIRGTYPPNKRDRVKRNTESTFDAPKHWLCLDVDSYEPLCDPVAEPAMAAQDFVLDRLPAQFHDISFVWQLSASAGAPGNEHVLKAHLWFLCDEALDGASLREWAKRTPGLDPAVFRQVQAIYTAAPLFEPGVLDPVPRRLGLYEGLAGDEVSASFLGNAWRPVAAAGDTIDEDADISKLRAPVSDYDLERVVDEVLAHLDPDAGGHDAWLEVGMALSHQFDGSEEALAAWDEWSSSGATWQEGECETRWASFAGDRTAGTGAVTLRALLKKTKDQRIEQKVVEAKAAQQPGTGNAERVLGQLMATLELTDMDNLGESIRWNAKKFDRTLGRVAWDANRGQFKIMTPDGALLLATREHVATVLRERGMVEFYDAECLDSVIDTYMNPSGAAPRIVVSKQEAFAKMAAGLPLKRLLDFAIAHRQFTTVTASVDPFVKKGGMRLLDGVLTLVYPHEPLTEGPVNQAIVDDYRQHFPQVDDFLDLLCASRFATDRKTAHLWMHADSNFGKSFLCGMLKRHGLVIETSVAEIEKIMGGGPAGLTLEAMRRAWLLAVDEFKGVTRELKQLSTELTFAPKNQARVTVPLYLKLFMSAEDVPSLVSDDTGADAQFRNRFMKLRACGDLTVRPAYARSRAAYADSIANFFAAEVNRRTETYRAAGQIGAADLADETLVRMHQRYPLSPAGAGGTLEDRIPEMADQFSEELAAAFRGLQEPGRKSNTPLERIAQGSVFQKDDSYYVIRARKCVDDWLDLSYPKGEAAKVRYKRDDFIRYLGGSVPVRPESDALPTVVKAVRLSAVAPTETVEDAFMA